MLIFFQFLSASFAVPTIFWSQVRPYNDDFYKNEISYRPAESKVFQYLPTNSTE